MTPCKNCKRELTRDEIALYRRLIFRDAESQDCLCLSCLASQLRVSEGILTEKIEHFKKMGCTLFTL